MRLLILTLILNAFWTTNISGQVIPCQEGSTVSINQNGDSIVSHVEKMPFLKGGLEPYVKWVKNNMDKKLISKKKEPKKKVYVGFIVYEDGTTSDFKIDKGVGEPYDTEALRLIRSNPQTWVAGQCGKKKVKTRMTMPVVF
jgi:hypothetical protein